MTMNIETIVFDGQGSLDGKPLLQPELLEHPGIRRIYELADQVTGKLITEASLSDSLEKQLANQQLVNYVHQMAIYFLLTGHLNIDRGESLRLEHHFLPQFFTGFSLGFYAASTGSGVISFRTGLEAVSFREKLMMGRDDETITSSVVGRIDPEYLAGICQEVGDVELSIRKCPGNYSIGGLKSAVEEVKKRLDQDKVLKIYAQTPVKRAIHTIRMQSEAKQFGIRLKCMGQRMRLPIVPLIATDEQATVFSNGNYHSYADFVGDYCRFLEDHIFHQVHFDRAVLRTPGNSYAVIGKGARHVAGFIERNLPGRKVEIAKFDDLKTLYESLFAVRTL